MRLIPQKISDRLAVFFEKYGLKIFLITVPAVIILLVMWPYVAVTIYSGEAGVLYRRFTGTEMEKIYPEGLHFIFPWNKMHVYEVRVQNRTSELKFLTKNGLPVTLQIAIRFQPEYDSLTKLHKFVGPEYFQRVVLPEIESVFRREIGRYEPIDIYSTRYGVLDQIILQSIDHIAERFIRLDDILIKSVKLPEPIHVAIEEKLTYEQRNLAYQYRLQLEEQEAKRKLIEAKGIHDYHKKINETLTNDLIRWEGVRATKELATSKNAKTVIVGGGKDGLPVILGNVDSPPANPVKQ